MTWTDMYFTFLTKAAADAALAQAGLDGRSDGTWAMDRVSTLYDEPVGDVLVPLPGYHINLRTKGGCPDCMSANRVYPATPRRTWLNGE